ncbi:hypothetical protein ACJMK2_033106 [Sinanodonta woodiana]|uniref:C2H2-type domain-containing protein n=1 Tax=Sinanodonta woodiana TaxID=1069815 RepID=A0ABD3X4E1_SINWO
MEGQWKRINPELSKMLHQAILNLCCKMYTSEAGLEVDGIICVSAVDSSEQQVVKIHEILRKNDSSVDIFKEKGTMGLYVSSKEQIKSNKVILTESECRVASPKDSSDLKEKKRKRKLSGNDVQSNVNTTPSKMYADSPLEMTVDLVDQNDSSADQSKDSYAQGRLSIETGDNFSRVTFSGCDETYNTNSGKDRVVSPTLSTSLRQKGRRKKASPRHVSVKNTIAYKTDSSDHRIQGDSTGVSETDTSRQHSLPCSNHTSSTGSAEKIEKVSLRMKTSHQEILLMQNKHDRESKTQEAQSAVSESDMEFEHGSNVTNTRLANSKENSWHRDFPTHASDQETDISSSCAQKVQIKQEVNDESYNLALNINVQSSPLNSGKELWTGSGEEMYLTRNKSKSETKRQDAQKVSSESDQEVEHDTIMIKAERVDSEEHCQLQELENKNPKDNDCPHLASLLSRGTRPLHTPVENTLVQSRSSSEDSREGSSPRALIQSNSDQEWLMKVTANAYRYQNSLMKKGTVPVSPHVGISGTKEQGSGTSSPDNKEVLARLAGTRSSSNSPLPGSSNLEKKETTRLESRYPALYNQLQKAKSPENRKSSTSVTHESSSLLSRLPFISFQELFPHTPSPSSSLSDTRTQFSSSSARIKRKGHMKYTMLSESRDSDWTPNEDEENDIEWKASTKVKNQFSRGQQAQSVSVRTRLSTGTKPRQTYTEEDDDVEDVEEVEEMEYFDDYDHGGRDQIIVPSAPIPMQEDNFTCGLCGLQFNQEYRWQFHMTKVHGLKTEDRGGI